MDDLKVIEGAEEFSLVTGGPVGALLVHGFQGSPQGMRALGEYLSERGISVVAPRLPGHGTSWQDLNTRMPEEWTQTVEDGYAKLAAECEEIFLVGLSFGAALVVDFAARNPGKVAGIVSLAGWVYTKDPLKHVAPLLVKLVSSLPPKSNDIADPEGHEIASERFPAKAGFQANRFATKRARAALKEIRCPILVMAGRQDHTVPPQSSQIIYDEVATDDKELVWLERSYHVITLDYEREKVYAATFEFIKARTKHAL